LGESHRERRARGSDREPTAPAPPARSGDEEQRLHALRSYCVLDTPPEPAFERIASLARALFDAPTALVSLVDETRQWFKARHGFEPAETPRDWAFCAHTILSDEPLVVPDTLRDPLFAENPLVTGGPRIRFYAGAPIVTRDGLRLGSVCVVSPVPRDTAPGPQELARLQDLAAIATDHLELRLRTRALADTVAERDAALARAKQLAEESAALMREADHRVKNSLQLVHTALLAQARAEDDPRLRAAAARVLAVVAAHRHLQAAPPSAEAATDAGRYLAPLLRDLAPPAAFGESRTWWRPAADGVDGGPPPPPAAADGAGSGAAAAPRPVVLDDEGEILLPAGLLPRLGLVAVELVTNALKHGAGPVTVELRRGRGPHTAAVLSVRDQGPGFPSHFAVDDPARASLGMRFVTALVGRGNLHVDAADRRRIVARLATPEPSPIKATA
jgi:two-component sensor histidine kinase